MTQLPPDLNASAFLQQVAREVAQRFHLGQAPKPDGRVGAPFCAICDHQGQCASACATPTQSIRQAGADRIGAAPGVGALPPDIAATIDHTLLKPDTTQPQVEQLCAEAAKFGFASVCVNPFWVPYCAQLLRGHTPAVCTVIGFPLGANQPAIKAAEARQAIADGATEIDMVLNIGALKSGRLDLVEEDIRAVREATRGVILKVILETALLDDPQKVAACEASVRAGADFVKTSTGFSTGGATAADVALMRRVVGPGLGVKASGGVRSKTDADLMIKAGANRIGASAGVKIVQETQGLKPAASSGGGGY